jgi:ABC-type dipeptide/oligopeptide/nickel transport system permease subunit
MGRCVLSRLLYAPVTLGITLIGSGIVIALGLGIGLMIGQRQSGSVVIESVLNAVTAIPPIAYLIIFIGAWGNGIPTMLIALVTSNLMRVIKLVKSRTEIELTRAYALCAIASGASRAHLLFVHVAPNILREVVHFVCLSCTDMVMAIVSFSFIGLGLGDDVIDWA